MAWYTASLIQVIRLKEGRQEIFPVFENYKLIEASSVKEAFEKADKIGVLEESMDDTLRFCGKPAYYAYMGVRKMIEIWDDILTSGVEVSHSYMEVETEEQLKKLSEGKAVMVNYIDMDDMEDTKSA